MNKSSRVIVADNSGALEAEIFHVFKGFKHLSCKIGDIVMVAVKRSIPGAKASAGTKWKAVIVRTVNPIRRSDGSLSRAGDNAVVLLDNSFEPIGTSVKGYVAREVTSSPHEGVRKIASMSKEVY